MNFPERLKELRITSKLTQEELARKIFVSRTLISKYESGNVIPSKENIEKLALVFNVGISDLLDYEDSTLLSLEYARYSIVSNNLFSFLAVLINLIWIVISFLPIFGTWRHVYPIPEGATQPEREYHVFSFLQNSLEHGSYMVVVSIVYSLLLIVLIGSSFFIKNKKAHFICKWAIRVFFIIGLFLILIASVFGFANGDL